MSTSTSNQYCLANIFLLFLRCDTHIYLRILESLLQVLIDRLVGDLADKRQIRHADLFLLVCLVERLLDRSASAATAAASTSSAILLSAGPAAYCGLHESLISIWSIPKYFYACARTYHIGLHSFYTWPRQFCKVYSGCRELVPTQSFEAQILGKEDVKEDHGSARVQETYNIGRLRVSNLRRIKLGSDVALPAPPH